MSSGVRLRGVSWRGLGAMLAESGAMLVGSGLTFADQTELVPPRWAGLYSVWATGQWPLMMGWRPRVLRK